ncbi:MSCRAMM family protein [Lapidilactobacillus luobeiensis]|uniref:MSCRAMM family protein n=1 Tax=Lapidilactobacillus luobeiensis TaxID=2950371 RepID=UPI0021C28314|nr:MucBP domain-containing protein [Lapidilactobacillus luobeiensis]
MKSKLRHLLMAFLLLAQILVAPAGLVKGAEETGPAVSGQLTVQNPSTVGYPVEKSIGMRTSIQVSQQALDQGSIRITLSKKWFSEPQDTDTTSAAAQVESVERSADVDNFYITFKLKPIGAGTFSAEYPFSVRPLSPNIAGSVASVKQEIFGNGQDTALATSSLDLLLTTVPRGFDYVWPTKTIYQEKELNSDNESLEDRAVTLASPGDRTGTDRRGLDVTFTFPENVTFNDTQSNRDAGWQFDATKNTVSLHVPNDQPLAALDLIVKAGTKVGKITLPLSYRYPNSADIVGTTTATLELIDARTLAAKTVVPQLIRTFPGLKDDQGNALGRANINQIADHQPVSTKIWFVTKGSLAALGMDDHLKLTRLTITPDSFAKDGDDIVSTNRISFWGSVPSNAFQNQLIGIDKEKNETVLATNIGSGGQTFDSLILQKYNLVELRFTAGPILLNSSEMGLLLDQSVIPEEVEKFRQSEYSSIRLSEAVRAGYESNFVIKDVYNSAGEDSLLLTKTTLPKIRNERFTLTHIEDGIFYYGPDNYFLVSKAFNLSSFSDSKAKLDNPLVYFIVPNGVTYDSSQSSLVKGLRDIKVQRNFNNSGKTAIIGTPDSVLTTTTMNVFGVNESFTIPLIAENILRSGKKNIETYLAFTNNNGNYSSLLGDSSGQSVEVTTSVNKDKEWPEYTKVIYEAVDNPEKRLADEFSVNYMGPTELVASSTVKAKGDSTFVTQLSGTASKLQQLTYRMNLYNPGNATVKKFGMITQLPRQGDKKGSEFNVYLNGPIVTQNGEDSPDDFSKAFNIYYSTSSDQPDQEGFDNDTIWKTADQVTDFKGVTMIKLQLKSGIDILPKTDVNFDYPATVNASELDPNAIARTTVGSTIATGADLIYTPNVEVAVEESTAMAKITKVDAITGDHLNNAVFELYDYDSDQQLNADQIYRTNTLGELKIPNLVPGHYYLKEIQAPIDHVLPEDKKAEKEANQFSVKENQEDAVELTIKNVPISGALQLTAQDQDTQELLAGANFGLYLNGVQVQELTSTTEISLLDKLLPGVYTIKVLTAPVGYKLNDAAEQNFKIDQDHKDAKITFNFQKLPVPVQGKVTVHYQDVEGNKIADSEELKGEVGTEYQAVEKAVADYTFKEVIGADSGQFTEADQEVTFIYEKVVAQGKVTVHYQDVEGKKIADSEVLEGEVGTEYQAEKKRVTGYTFKEVTGADSGQFTAADQEVTFIYEKETPPEPVAQGQVTVHYQDVEGNQIADSEELKGEVGTEYHAEKKVIVGYDFKEVKVLNNRSQTGHFTEVPQELVFVYQKQAVTPEKPDEVDPQPEQPKQPDKATSANKVTKQTEKAKSKQARLPQAGNRESMSALLIGSILFLLIGVVIIKKEIEQ